MSDHAVRNRRLRLAQAEWRFQERNGRAYSTYRNGRPYAPLRRRRGNQQLKETLLLVGAVIIGWLLLVVAE